MDRDITYFVARPSAGWSLYDPGRNLVSRHASELEAARRGIDLGATTVFVIRPDGTTHTWAPPAQ